MFDFYKNLCIESLTLHTAVNNPCYYFCHFNSDWDKSDYTVVRNIFTARYIYTNDLAKSRKSFY